MKIRVILSITVLSLLCVAFAAAQDDDLAVRYDSALARWKQAAKDAISAAQQFALCPLSEAESYRQQWLTAVETGRREFQVAVDVALEMVQQRHEAITPEMIKLVTKTLDLYFDSGSYAAAEKVCDGLLEVNPSSATLLNRRVFISFYQNQFDRCASMIERMRQATSDLPANVRAIADNLATIQANWQAEQELRQAEEQKADLPQVRLICDVGEEAEIVIELYEDHAPNCVASFVHLVNQGFYNNSAFDQVITHADAQAASPGPDGSNQPGYLVNSEFLRPDARHLFRGTVVMVPTADQRGVGGEFAILYSPRIDNQAGLTAIGRVVSGMDVVDRVARTHFLDMEKNSVEPVPGVVPTSIISAEVIRDRGHAYEPVKIEP